MPKPLIGITAGEIRNSQHAWMSINYAQGHAYSDAIVRAGGLPVILPLVDEPTVLEQLYNHCDAILLAGGNDIDPGRFKQPKHVMTADISQKRDQQETSLLDWALRDDKAVLGICRGMQLLNVHCGGSLYQHLPEHLPSAGNHEISKQHQNTTQIAHQLAIEASSKLARILGATQVATNSQHHQAIDVLGRGLSISARAEDGVIEGIEMLAKKFVVAVQSHPEGLEATVEPTWRRLFRAFVQAATG